MTNNKRNQICNSLDAIKKVISSGEEMDFALVNAIIEDLNSICAEIYSDWYFEKSIRDWEKLKNDKELLKSLLNELEEKEES